MHSHAHTYTHTHTHTHTHTQSHLHSHTHTVTLTQSHSHSHTYTVTRTHKHTHAPSQNGCGYTCGSSRYGQLGHGDFTGVDTPKILIKLIGDEIFQIACGRCVYACVYMTAYVFSSLHICVSACPPNSFHCMCVCACEQICSL